MNFTEWQATRTWSDNLALAKVGTDPVDWPTDCSGFYYADCTCIEATEGGASPAVYTVTIHNDSRNFAVLEDAERHLWDNFASDIEAHS